MLKKKGKKGSKGSKDKPKGKGGKGKKDAAPPTPTGKSGSPPKSVAPSPPEPPPPPLAPAAGPPQPSPEVAENVQQTNALKELMDRKMTIWNRILTAPKDVDRKEGLKQYRTIAEEELRIIARNISKTKLQELIDQKVNYFVQVGISDSEDKKIANMQGFRQVGEEERVLCALEAPEVAPRVFGDIALDEAPPLRLDVPPTALPPGAFGGQPVGPVQKESFTSLVRDTTVLDRLADQMATLDKATLQSRRRSRAGPYGGVMLPGMHPPPLPLSSAMERQQVPEQRQQDHAQLMQQAQMMSARLPKRRLPPVGQTPQVERKSRLVSEFAEKLAEEIASNRISKAEARKQLRDIVEMENELTETLVSATTVKPDLTEEKLQAIADMYKEISFTVISNPEMNREEALNKLKRVTAMEHELTQALVSDEEMQERPYQQQSAEDSVFKLQQMKLNLTDDLQRNMAVSQPDANRVQDSIKKLYELELRLMDKLFTAKSERDRGRELSRRRDSDYDEDGGRRACLRSGKRPTTTIELSFGSSEPEDDSSIVPVVQMKRPELRTESEGTGKSCPVHGDRKMPCPLHPKDKKKGPSCPVHSERQQTTFSWALNPFASVGTSRSTVAPDRTTRQKGNGHLEEGHREQAPGSQPSPQFHPYPGHPYPRPHPGQMIPPAPGPWAPPMHPQYPPWEAPAAYSGQSRQPQQLGRTQQRTVDRGRPPEGAEPVPDRPPAEPRIIVPTRYKDTQQEPIRNEAELPYFGDASYYTKQTWDTTAQEMSQHYMTQGFPRMYPVMPIGEPVFYSSAQAMSYRRTPNVDAAVDAAQPITESGEDGEESGPVLFETGIEINVSPSGTQVVPVAHPTKVVVHEVKAPVSVPLAVPLLAKLEPAPPPVEPLAPRQRSPRRPRAPQRSQRRSRERNLDTYSDDDNLDDTEESRYRRPRRSSRRGRRRGGRSWRSGLEDDSERPAFPRRRKRRSRTSQRSRRSYTESAGEDVPPGVSFWDWICKSICNLLPFSRDASGSKGRRGVTIQELVTEVMATSEEVVQAKRELQSNNGNPEASVRSMGDLEGKLWKLIDLEVDLVNELARYRWSGDVQDPRAELKLNNAEEKIWKVIGVQTRLAQDLGDWRKNSTRTFQPRGPEPFPATQPPNAPSQPYGSPATRGNMGNYGNYNPVSYESPTMYDNPATGYYMNSGRQAGPGNPPVPSNLEPKTSSEAEESTPIPAPKVKKKSSKASKTSKASKKSKRSARAARKKQRKQQQNNLSNDASLATTTGKKSRGRKSSKKRSRSRGLSPDMTSSTTTITSLQSSEASSSEGSSGSTDDFTSTAVSDPDSMTITNTLVISSEADDAEDNQKPSAVSWKSPSKEFLASIDRSQVTPVEWETKRKGRYIYVRPRQVGAGRKPERTASHSPPRTAKPRARRGARRHSAGPKDSFELHEVSDARYERDPRRAHSANRRVSSHCRVDRWPSPHGRLERPRSHIYARPPEYWRSHDRHRHSVHRHQPHAHCDPYVRRRRFHREADDGEPVVSATISMQTSDGTAENYGRRLPRDGYGAAYYRGGRRRYRSVGPHSSRSVRHSRSQWSV